MFQYRILYFAMGLPFGVVISYIFPHLVATLTIPEESAGLIIAGLGVVLGISAPIWGYISDKLKNDRLVVALIGLIGVALSAGCVFVKDPAMIGIVVAVLGGLLYGGCEPMLGKLTNKYCQKYDKNLGTFRMFLSIGLFASAVAGGFIAEAAGGSTFPVFWIGIAGGILAFFLSFTVEDVPVEDLDSDREDYGRILDVLKNKAFLVLFIIGTLGVGITAVIEQIFSYVVFAENAGNMAFWGIAAATAGIIEAIITPFAGAGKGDKRFLILQIGLFYMVAEFLVMMFVPGQWGGLIARAMATGMYGYLLTAGISVISKIIPPDLQGTAIGTYFGIGNGLGLSVFGMAGTMMLTAFGASYTFVSFALLMLVAAVILVPILKSLTNKQINTNQ